MFFKSLDSEMPDPNWWVSACLYRSVGGVRRLLVRGGLVELILAVNQIDPAERAMLTIKIEGDPDPMSAVECAALVERSDFPILV